MKLFIYICDWTMGHFPPDNYRHTSWIYMLNNEVWMSLNLFLNSSCASNLMYLFPSHSHSKNQSSVMLQRMPTGGIEVCIREFRMVQPGKKSSDNVCNTIQADFCWPPIWEISRLVRSSFFLSACTFVMLLLFCTIKKVFEQDKGTCL